MASKKLKQMTTLQYAKALSITPQAVVKKVHNFLNKKEFEKRNISSLTTKEKRVLIGNYFPKGTKIERNCREWIIYVPVDGEDNILFDAPEKI